MCRHWNIIFWHLPARARRRLLRRRLRRLCPEQRRELVLLARRYAADAE